MKKAQLQKEIAAINKEILSSLEAVENVAKKLDKALGKLKILMAQSYELESKVKVKSK